MHAVHMSDRDLWIFMFMVAADIMFGTMSIAAASILAKVARDRICAELDAKYPEYKIAKHKGYGTKEHKEALFKYGPSPIHRKQFIRFLDKKDEE